jgi:hypothetical protein
MGFFAVFRGISFGVSRRFEYRKCLFVRVGHCANAEKPARRVWFSPEKVDA